MCFRCAIHLPAHLLVLSSRLSRVARFDLVIGLSLTMWIHLRQGDDGLFDFLSSVASLTDRLVIEPQPWKCCTSVLCVLGGEARRRRTQESRGSARVEPASDAPVAVCPTSRWLSVPRTHMLALLMHWQADWLTSTGVPLILTHTLR
jgi:Bicoid-interacting protein 3 (Bin3)